MTGADFFAAIYRGGVDLPVRIYFSGIHPNIYRPHALSFCSLTLDEDESITTEKFSPLEGFDVSIMADRFDDQARELAKVLIAVRPRHLVVCAGNDLHSWAPARGWK